MGKAAHPAAKGPLYYFGDVHSIPFLVSNLAPFFSFFFFFLSYVTTHQTAWTSIGTRFDICLCDWILIQIFIFFLLAQLLVCFVL